MSSDHMQNIIDNITKRIAVLETIYDINVPKIIEKREKLYDNTKKCPVNFVGEAIYGIVATSFGRVPMKITVDLWTVPNGLIQNIQSLDILKEFYKRDFSNGIQNKLVLSTCNVNYRSTTGINNREKSKQVVVKFRELKNTQVDPKKPTLTQTEGQNAIDTYFKPETKDLFPFIYFIFSLKTDNTTWECIGTEPLVEIKPTDPGFYEDAFNLLKELHDQGFTHGDPHRGNFMKLPPQSFHPRQNKSGVIMIDQDCITPIPREESKKALANYMIISDLNMLLQWNNPYFNVWHRFVDVRQEELAAALLYKRTTKISFVRPPWEFGKLRDTPTNIIQQHLDKEPEYKQFLQQSTTDQIYQNYEALFKSTSRMSEANKQFIDFLRSKGIKFK